MACCWITMGFDATDFYLLLELKETDGRTTEINLSYRGIEDLNRFNQSLVEIPDLVDSMNELINPIAVTNTLNITLLPLTGQEIKSCTLTYLVL